MRRAEPYAAAADARRCACASPAERRRPCTPSPCSARSASSPSAAATRPTRRSRLVELFGERARWGETLRPFLWTHVATTVAGFTGATEVDLPCRAPTTWRSPATKYLHALATTATSRWCCCSRAPRSSAGASGLSVAPVRLARGGHVPPAGGGLAGHDGPLLPEQRVAHASAGPCSTRSPGSRPTRASSRGTRRSSACSRKPERRRDRRRPARPLRRGPRRSPTPCSTRATCCTRTGPRRARTSCAGSSACSSRGARPRLDGSERWSMRTECVVDPGAAPRSTSACGACRCQHRTIEEALEGGGFEPVDVARRRRRHVGRVGRGRRARHRPSPSSTCCPRRMPAGRCRSTCPAAATSRSCAPTARTLAGRAVRAREAVDAVVCASRRVGRRNRRVPAPSPSTVENVTDWCDVRAPIATRSCAGTRWSPCTPCWPSTTARSCRCSTRRPTAARGRRRVPQRRHLPGARRPASDDVVLSSPIILYDHPESPRRARATSSTPPRSTRSSAFGCSPSPTPRRPRRGAPTPGRRHRRPLRRHAAGGVGAPARRRAIDRPGRRSRPPSPTPWWDPGADAAVDPWTRHRRRRRHRGRHGHQGRSCGPATAGPTPTTCSSPA